MKRIDVSSLMWGVIFALVAGFGLWVSAGGHVDWHLLKIVAPIVLIGLGITGLVLSRPGR